MSLEELIVAHTAALEANTKALEANTAANSSKGEGKTPSKKTPTAAEKKAATEKAAAEMAEEDAKKAAAKKTAAKKKAEKITKESLVSAFSGFLSEAQDDEDLLAERREYVKKISAHYDVKKISDLDENDYEEAISALSTLLAGEIPEILKDEEESSEDDLV